MEHLQSDKEKYLNLILTISETSINIFPEYCKPTDKKGQFEIFIFNIFYCWTYYTERGLLTTNDEIKQRIINYLFGKTVEFGFSSTEAEFFKFYSARFYAIQIEFKEFSKSDNTRTQQFLPIFIFSIFYYNRL